MTKAIILLFVGIISILWLNIGNTCGGYEKAKPIIVPSLYPRGYLYKHFTPCHGKWYPKGYKCKSKKKVKL